MARMPVIARVAGEILLLILPLGAAVFLVLHLASPEMAWDWNLAIAGGVLLVVGGPLLAWRATRWLAVPPEPGCDTGRATGRMAWIVSIGVLAFSLLMSGWVTVALRRTAHGQAQEQFNRLAEQIQSQVARRAGAFTTTLRGARGLFTASDAVTAAEFREFVDSLNLDLETPGARGVGFIECVPRADLGAFLQRTEVSAASAFQVRTSGSAEDLFIVRFIEPLARNSQASGYDIGSESIRRAAAERARDTAEPTLTAPIPLVQDRLQRPGLLYLLPIYRQGGEYRTLDERRKACIGWVYIPLIIGEVLGDLVDGSGGLIDLMVFDGSMASGDAPILHTGTCGNASSHDPAAHAQQGFHRRIAAQIGGRDWTFDYASTPQFESTHDHPTRLSIAVGLLISVLLFGVTWSLASAQSRAQVLAGVMTRRLEQAKREAEQTAETLRHEREQLEVSLGSARLGSWVWNPVTGEHTVDDRYLAVIGRTREEYAGTLQDALATIHPEDWPGIQDALDAHCRGEEPTYHQVFRTLHADGTYRWVAGSGKVTSLDETGRPTCVVGILQDLTTERETQRLLTEQRERLEFMLEGGDLGAWDWNMRTNQTVVNARWASMLGERLEDLRGEVSDWSSRLHPEDEPRLWEIAREHFAGRLPICEMTYRMRHKDGSWRWIHARGRVVERAEDGSPLRMAGTHADVTEQRNLQDLVQNQRERLELALTGGRLASWDWRCQTGENAYDEAWAAMVGERLEDLPQHIDAWSSRVHPDDLPSAMGELERHFRGETEYYECTYRIRHKNGSYRWILGRGRVVERDASGRPVRMVGTHHDVTEQHRLQELLREQHERLEMALSSGGMGTWEYQPQTKIATLGPHACAIMGEPAVARSAEGSFWQKRFYPEDLPRIVAALEAHARDATPFFHMTARIRLDDGSCRWISARGRIVERDAAGRPARLLGTLIDITREREMQGIIAHQKERLELALKGADLGTWDWNPQTNELVVDERWAAIIGERVEDVGTTTSAWADRVHPDDYPMAWQIVGEHLAGRTDAYEVTHRMRHRDGSWRWILARARVFERDEAGRPIRVVGTHLDLTNEYEARRLQRESEARLQAIIEGADVIAWEFDWATTRFTYVSPQAARFGYPVEQWLEPGFFDNHIHPEDREEAIQTCRSESLAGRNHRLQYRMLTATGEVVWIEDFVCVERQGDRLTLRGVMIDVTESRRLREAAEEASRAKSAFLANMSHEMRTPLTAILGFADILHEEHLGGVSPAHRLQTIDTIRSAGRHLLTLINDILDLSKIEAGKLEVEKVECDLPALLGEAMSLCRPQAAGKGVDLHWDLETALPRRVKTDPTRLRQIFMNLLGNATKFTEGGSIAVHLCVLPGARMSRLRIEVADTGIGMTPDQARQLFSPFMQAEVNTTRRYGGTGLGLTISRRLARLMGGDVILIETAPGRGTRFRIEIPIEEMPDTPRVRDMGALTRRVPPAPSEKRSGLGGRILLAEDGPDNQRLIAFHLRKAGATVEIAENGRIALDLIEQADACGEPFDLLLTDMQMPEMDGYDLARTLKARGSALPIVALTAHAMPEDRQKCIEAGCDDYLQKPLNKGELLDTCGRWMAQRV